MKRISLAAAVVLGLIGSAHAQTPEAVQHALGAMITEGAGREAMARAQLLEAQAKVAELQGQVDKLTAENAKLKAAPTAGAGADLPARIAPVPNATLDRATKAAP